MTNIENTTPSRGIGDNIGVDQAQVVTDRLTQDFAELTKNVAEGLDAARAMPAVVTADHEAIMLGAVIKQLRDLDKRVESHRESEKQPFLRSGNAVDSFFFALRDKIARRNKGDRSVKPGAADILQARIDSWQEQKEAAERARLEAERLEAQRLMRIEQERLRKAQEEAAEAERAAARARSEATRAARQAEVMAAAEAEAKARFEAQMAAEKAEEARLATLVKPADITRTRGTDASGGGVLLTSAKEPYALLVDRTLLDMDALRPYFTDAELEKAIRGWAKATGFKKQMAGAEVGTRSKGVTR